MSDKNSVPPTRTKACVYMRNGHDDISMEVQRERLLALAERASYEIVHWYEDDGYSGADANRPDWCKLLADAPTAEWTVILCLNLTRFSRLNGVENGMAIQILKESGKKFHSAIEGPVDWDATACEIIDQMIDAEEDIDKPIVVEGMKTQPAPEVTADSVNLFERLIEEIDAETHRRYSENLARRSLEGQLRAFQEGRRLFARCPYGYACIVTDPHGTSHRLSRNERFAVPKGWTKILALGVPEEIEVVQWVFTTFAQHEMSIRSLARELNAKGISAPMGRAWSPGAVADMLANDTYVGDTRFGRRSTGRFVRLDGDKVVWVSHRREDDEKEGLVRQNTHEPIISRELWERVQEKLQRRKEK